MNKQRQYVLSIAGYDPTGGAGVMADVKTLEQLGCYGMAVCTTITSQTEDQFYSSNWVSVDEIKQQLLPLLGKYDFSAIKIALIESLQVLEEILDFITAKTNNATIIWDPVLKASSGFTFHENVSNDSLQIIARKLSLITPNLNEAAIMAGSNYSEGFIKELSGTCPILLKGGHAESHANDLLFIEGETTTIEGQRVEGVSKHGTGCVLSSAIAGYMALDESIESACSLAKKYVSERLIDDGSGLMIHNLERVYD